MQNNIIFVCLTLIISFSAFAIPIDWHGKLGADTTIIDEYRHIDTRSILSADDGSIEPPFAPSNHRSASFQTYIFTLEPHIIINDATSITAEFSNGYGKGGILGQGLSSNPHDTMGQALHYYSTSKFNNNLTLNQFYITLYSDTATWIIGRHSKNWALGAIYNSGKDLWDRHSFIYDGVTMELKIGNFYINPYWARVNASNALTRLNQAKDYGFSLLYDNPDKDFAMGLMYSKKISGTADNTITSDITGSSLNGTSIKIVDLYFRKEISKLQFEIEVPLMTGNLGNVYASNIKTDYKAKAFLLESTYTHNDFWNFTFNAGQVSGDNGQQSQYEALYLNPNYKIAKILFNYNLFAIADSATYNLFDAYVHNAQYLKMGSSYKRNKWTWNLDLTYAKALEVAKAGSVAYNHFTHKVFTAKVNQKDDLGMEIDFGFVYKWNKNVILHSDFAYLLSGDYFTFTNDPANTPKSSNSYLLQTGLMVSF